LYGREIWSLTLKKNQRLSVKSTVFWDVTPFSPAEVHRRFVGTYCHHPHSKKQKASRGRGYAVLASFFIAGFSLGLLFDPEIGGSIFLRHVGGFLPITRRYIPEDTTIHSHLWENSKSNMDRVFENGAEQNIWT
jgi:hypothetical protein